MPEARSFLRPSDLAERWGVSVGHLSNLRVRGAGPAYLKLNNGTVRYALADVEAYEDASRVEAVA